MHGKYPKANGGWELAWPTMIGVAIWNLDFSKMNMVMYENVAVADMGWTKMVGVHESIKGKEYETYIKAMTTYNNYFTKIRSFRWSLEDDATNGDGTRTLPGWAQLCKD